MERKTLHDWDVARGCGRCRASAKSTPGADSPSSTTSSSIPQRLERYGLALRQVYRRHRRQQRLVQRRLHRASRRSASPSAASDSPPARTTSRRIVVTCSRRGARARRAMSPTCSLAPMPRQGAVTRDGRGERRRRHGDHAQGRERPRRRERVKARHRRRSQRALPAGVTIVPFYDQTEVIDRTSATVRRNLSRARCWWSSCCSSSCATSGRR